MAIGMHRSVRIALWMAPPLLWATQLLKLPLYALEAVVGIVHDRSADTAAQVTVVATCGVWKRGCVLSNQGSSPSRATA